MTIRRLDTTPIPNRTFWKALADREKRGEIPLVEVSTSPVQLPKPKNEPFVNPERPFAHYRTVMKGGRHPASCCMVTCRNKLKRHDLLVCSERCRQNLIDYLDRVRSILDSGTQGPVDTEFLKYGFGYNLYMSVKKRQERYGDKFENGYRERHPDRVGGGGASSGDGRGSGGVQGSNGTSGTGGDGRKPRIVVRLVPPPKGGGGGPGDSQKAGTSGGVGQPALRLCVGE